ncbi:MAG TPA: hypothetical protein VLA91_02545 [Acidimicrobiia bacterium]|nr:hypothetical protein [Acidimicrobiia bacterium]
MTHSRRLLIALLAVAVLMVTAGPALAQSGHFLTGGGNAPTCTDIGTQVSCSGKVAGLGGTTFEITIEADGIAEVVCINPGGNRAPGQDTSVTVAGSTDPLPTPRNGQYRFTVTTDSPDPLPSTPTCPNPQWTAQIVDIRFTTATLSLFEDGVLSDQVVVPVS